MQFPLIVSIFVNENQELFVELDQKPSKLDDGHVLLIKSFIAYAAKSLFNFGKNEFTNSIIGLLDEISQKLMDSTFEQYFVDLDFKYLHNKNNSLYKFDCEVRENDENIFTTTPWTNEVQEHENLGPLVLYSIVAFIYYLYLTLDEEDIKLFSKYISQFLKYVKSEADLNNINDIIIAARRVEELVNKSDQKVYTAIETPIKPESINEQIVNHTYQKVRNKDAENALIFLILSFFGFFTIIIPILTVYYGIKGNTFSEMNDGEGRVTSIISIILGILFILSGLYSWA